LRIRFDSVSVSSVLWTVCLLILIQWNLKWVATWRTRAVWVTDRVARLNYESSIAFASLALEIIVLIVIWTSYQKRMRWAWFVMVVFVCVYFVPVHLLDLFVAIKKAGWSWWPEAVRQGREGRQLALGALTEITIFTLMVIAVVVPVRGFSAKNKQPHKIQKGRSDFSDRPFCILIPATTYVPTQLPVQYHRPSEA
jgi:hypothetical protein